MNCVSYRFHGLIVQDCKNLLRAQARAGIIQRQDNSLCTLLQQIVEDSYREEHLILSGRNCDAARNRHKIGSGGSCSGDGKTNSQRIEQIGAQSVNQNLYIPATLRHFTEIGIIIDNPFNGSIAATRK